ncbi:hypothetical protein DUI87_21534 [Hirundo rustica rustica]|uniref:Uncharacterized protein n=1 Tax=Hirundo rustica rustica TaxID=333673 RepID=A0A3M0JNS3_HIRRU|nr:hypothetical protein DUI87_21534 [Hirundo rustica rustica]
MNPLEALRAAAFLPFPSGKVTGYGVTPLRREEAQRRPHNNLQLPHDGKRGAGTDLWSLATGDRTRGNGLKLSGEI